MSISLQADSNLPQGYILVNGTAAATVKQDGSIAVPTLSATNITTSSNLTIPVGSYVNRPATPIDGSLRYSTSLSAVEIYSRANNNWYTINDGIVSTPAYASTGGTITTSGPWRIHTFTSGTSSITFTQSGRIQFLLVGGGGAGGWDVPGCGGGGGVVYSSAYPISAGTYNVTIGNGGTAPQSQAAATLGNGGTTAFNNISAFGGGGGGNWNGYPPLRSSTNAGVGCGGGGDGRGVNVFSSGGITTMRRDLYPYCICYANPGGPGGGTSDSYAIGGGGGGAGLPGESGDAGVARGGDGIPLDISGTLTYYAGGGGGASNAGTFLGLGGLGGGGTAASTGNPGTANTGGGGGAAFGSGTNNGTGGSGIAIIRYLVQ
jgi:hypothetical protein